jgi:hypothetical protein
LCRIILIAEKVVGLDVVGVTIGANGDVGRRDVRTTRRDIQTIVE